MNKMTFWGYKRPDGRVGIRNKILILPASVCASDTTRIIASQVESAVTFNNQNGCSQVPSDQQFTMDVMAGYAANPNVYGTIVISLGCENCQMDLVLEAIKERTNRFAILLFRKMAALFQRLRRRLGQRKKCLKRLLFCIRKNLTFQS